MTNILLNIIKYKHLKRLLLLVAMLYAPCSMFNVFAQIVIGGNIYGGGNAGNTGGSTSVTVRGGDIGTVYGGARMANVGGSSFVNIDGANASEDILIANVYGGNDISGTIGQSNVTTTVPTELENFEKSAGVKAIDNSWKTFILTSRCTEKHSATIEGTSVSADKYMQVIGTLYGGGNGDYVYKDAGGNDLKDGDNYIVRDATGATVATSKSAFSKPDLPKTYLELKGGCIAHVFGGGNAATVTSNTTINIDNSSDDLQKAVTVWRAVKQPDQSFADVINYLLSKIKINTSQSDLSSFAFNFARVFGGNNKADMAIRPKWHLQSGIIRDLYGGGNEGRMTCPEGLLLQIEGAGMTVQNVYGGCRKADVRPLDAYGNDLADDQIALDPADNPNNIPPGYAARVRVLGGHVTNVYGGNDISGNVYSGNTVGIFTRIYGNVYGGGNGSYAYTDNPMLKDDPDWRDFYYSPKDILGLSGDTFTGLQSAEALNIFRPNAEKVSILVRGEANKPVIVDGSLYVGGNSASLRKQTSTISSNNRQTHIKIGSYVTIDNVFLGNNGVNMVTEDILKRYAQNVNDVGETVTSGGYDFSQMDLTDEDQFAKYMEGCAMKVNPTVQFESIKNGDARDYVHYSTKFGSFFCGGNVGSILVDGKITVDFEDDVIIYDKVVGGCNNANVYKTDYNAQYLGGMLGDTDPVPTGSPAGTIGDKLELNFSGLKIQPMRWNSEHTALEWNTVDSRTFNPETKKYSPMESVAATSTDEEGSITGEVEPYHADTDLYRRFQGGNIYGGCYSSGHVNGNVIINLNASLVDRKGKNAIFDEIEVNEGEAKLYGNNEYTILKRNTGVLLDEQGMDPLGRALNVFGGGYGGDSEIWGSTTINLNAGYTFQIFGGGEQGAIGNAVSHTPGTNALTYERDERYSTYINLKGSKAGVYRGYTNATDPTMNDDDNMAEAEFIYGGSFEGLIAGSTHINLGNGRIFNSFAGSCNADILGHTETYIGRQANSDGTYTDGGGFPWIRDHVYGGNDLGGRILNTQNFMSRVSTDIQGKVYNPKGKTVSNTDSSPAPDVVNASAYMEYIQGRVENIFGGCYGDYDYRDDHYKAYAYTNSSTDKTDANLGTMRSGYYKPWMRNAFVNFKPNNHGRNSVAKIYGAGQGHRYLHTSDADRNKMQDRSYVLIDVLQNLPYFTNTEVFGAGDFSGVGMRNTEQDEYVPDLTPAIARDNADGVTASTVIDLMRGHLKDVYGASYKEGITRRTIVNVPSGSTIHLNRIFGGAYGLSNDKPCDVYESNINYNSGDAIMQGYWIQDDIDKDGNLMSGGIYGGNNSARRTLYSKININSLVYNGTTNNGVKYSAKVFGAGYGKNTWAQYTEVNLNNGASVYEVYGGGYGGMVLNKQSVEKTDFFSSLSEGYTDEGLNSYLVKQNPLGQKTNTNVYINKGAYVAGYCYGAGLGADATVSGTTYIGLHGGYVNKDLYAAGWGGAVYDKYKVVKDDNPDNDFVATTNAYIEGGEVRNVYGGGYEGAVGYHDSSTTAITDDILGVSNVTIGIRKDQVFPGNYVYDNAGQGDSLNYYKGVPAIQRNAYGAGEGGAVYGTANLTINNGYIGYYYDGIKEKKVKVKNAQDEEVEQTINYEAYMPQLDDNSWYIESERAGRLKDCGNAFGGGYDDKSLVDFTNIKMWGGHVRSSMYGGGEIATVGRGRTHNLTGLDRELQAIDKAGGTHIEMYNGHVQRNVFGGGKGYNILGYGGTHELYTDGYVFGQTEVYIHGGEVGTVDGVAEGYGNVFGGGDVGYVYSKGYFNTKTLSDKNVSTGSPGHHYYYSDYQCNSSYGNYKKGDVIDANTHSGMSADDKAHWTSGSFLTEDCKVVIAPYLQVKADNGFSINSHNHPKYDYVETEDLNLLPKKDGATKMYIGGWENLYTGDKDANGNTIATDPVERGVLIHNAVFAGGNVSSNSDKTYANATTVFGNTTATLYDVYHRDFITVGTEHTGGIYGGGNLSKVDGYRELNITNYGTDYYGQDDQIELEDYRKLSNRERAYFKLQYVCMYAEDQDDSGNTGLKIGSTFYKTGEKIDEDDYNSLPNEYKNTTYWQQYGFCSIYAGRLLNTIQRADFCGVYGSRMVLQGAKDRVTDQADATEYTINRVGELSLNQNRTVRTADTGNDGIHGNYFGIYSVVNYLGNLTSDVHFTDPYRKISNDQAEVVSGETYYNWKVTHFDKRDRNNGTSYNQVALASGVFLELTTENSTATKKVYGDITGIVELDLINVKRDIEGGGYVYARNEHGIPMYYPYKENVLLSEYNQQKQDESGGEIRDEACTYKRYRYSANQEGDWPTTGGELVGTDKEAYSIQPYQTSGNFIHRGKRIVDDCYPKNNSYSDGYVESPAHYWYIKGEVYIYDQVVSAYAGSATAYLKEVKIPLTITAGSNGRLTLLNVQPNLYAYYSAYDPVTNQGTKIGEADGQGNTADKVVVDNESQTFKLNDVITWWDWHQLSDNEQKLFVKETYVNVDTCYIDNVLYPAGTFVLENDKSLHGNDATKTDYKKFISGTHTILDKKQQPITDINTLIHPSNNISHDTGYVLTVDMNSPKDWDDWYSPVSGSSTYSVSNNGVTTTRKSDEQYKAMSLSEKAGYREGPTYTLKNGQSNGLYGQHLYSVGDIISKEIHDDYKTTTSGLTFTDADNQASVEEAYVALADAGNVQAGHGISKTEYNDPLTDKSNYAPAMVCTNTIQIGEKEYVLLGELVSATEDNLKALAGKYKTYNNTVLTNVDQIDDDAALEYIKEHLSNAYICTEEGLYGGQYFTSGTNYDALKAYCALTDDRTKFQFNYDAFDVLVDSSFPGEGSTSVYDGHGVVQSTAQSLYSASKPVEYEAAYTGGATGNSTLTYTKGSQTITLTKDSDPISREDYETYIKNEQLHYTRLTIDKGSDTQIIYIAKENFIENGTPFAKGQDITEKDYKTLSQNTKDTKITTLTFPQSSSAAKTIYYCYEDYTPSNTFTTESGTAGTEGSIISASVFNDDIPNNQKDFIIQGKEPTETTTLYVSRESNAKDVMSEKVITVVYQYTYYEPDDEGEGVSLTNELHVMNIHLQLESGAPELGPLSPPSVVLPGTKVGLKPPTLNPGLYEVITNGWEIFTDEQDANIHHRDGKPFINNSSKLYWYQNQKVWVAFYSKTYLGKTYSNAVPITVANYHDLDEVMQDQEHHMYVDHPDVDRPSKIYIDNRECLSDPEKSELDLLKDFFDLSLQSEVATSGETKDHALLDKHVRAGRNLEFFLNSDVSPKKYTSWIPIGYNDVADDPTTTNVDEAVTNNGQCFDGTLHGDGYTISGLSNSLFDHLCGDVYNLGVTGSFTSAGIANTGGGYVENCWVKSSAETVDNVKAVFGNPSRGKEIQLVNCYYPETNTYSETNNPRGNATKMTERDFYNGTVAYNLNGFYLNKRYHDKKQGTSGSEYKYRVADADGNLEVKSGYYPASPDAQYGDIGYVERRFADGDFVYAGGTIPESNDERMRIVAGTGENATPSVFYDPIWPDDYLFFGQRLTFGHFGYETDNPRLHQDLPSHIEKNSGRLLGTNLSNRVYRAPAYYRSKNMGVTHFNPWANLAAYSAPKTVTDNNLKPAYPNMTAVDFAGHNDDTWSLGSVSEGFAEGSPAFYPPLLDDDGLIGVANRDETSNLLVYAPAADVNEKTYNVLNAYFLDPTYDDYDEPGEGESSDYYTDDKSYGRVAVANTSSIHGHLVQSDQTTTTDHLLVDRKDFNCPIAYTMGGDYRMWYQRTPDRFVDRTKGWEGVSLPFTSEIVTTQDKGEITHFYQGSTVGHEYWLREYAGNVQQKKDIDNNPVVGVYTADFNPLAAGGNEKDYTNTFLWDYYYSKDSYWDKNTDEYQKKYYSQEYLQRLYPVSNYPYSQATKPYIIGFPGRTYYEFDLSDEWTPQNRYLDQTIASKGKQTVTFASTKGISIGVSDGEMDGVTASGLTFKPTYLNNPDTEGKNVYLLDNDGDSFDKTAAEAVAITAFRPYFIGDLSGTRTVEQIIFGQSDNDFDVEEHGDPRQDDATGTLLIYAKKGKIVVKSSLSFTEDVRVVTAAGITVAAFAVEAGQTVEVKADFSGMYIVHTLDGKYTKSVIVKK